jgi:uncharacterized protein involved in tolerance to divalent cations
MTQDEIIEMARQAEFVNLDLCSSELERFAKLVAQHEREACARICDDINAKYKWPDDVAERVASQWCADSIRARGQA